MLKLKKLQILGFKSFCDRTEMKFHGDGIAAVVGPNGCGKSNISDAISWVLGEQSAKSLRGVRMEDVIFAGTRDRKPLGMAEVSLTLIDPEVYGGSAVGAEPQIEIEDELSGSDDWDEASVRSAAAEDADMATLEAQPGRVLDENGNEVASEVRSAESDEIPEVAEADAPPEGPVEAGESNGNQVVLRIRRRKFKATRFQAGEIVVTRRLFRTGDSEYLLNGKLCRLRDIQDIFMGTGLGPESYAIIEQGRIGQILSSKPHDRRAIIEEAAGITKYKTRKRLAEARLEQAKLNLSRINDIFDEVTRQMNSLKRQAAKAERYAKLRDEMRDKLRVVLASKFAAMAKEAAKTDDELTQLAEQIRTRGEVVEQMEVEHSDRTQRGYALEGEATITRERISSIHLEADRATSRSATNQERCAELISRTAAAEGELLGTEEQLQNLLGESATNRTILETAAADVAAAQSEAQIRQQAAITAALAVADADRQQEARRGSVMDLMTQVGRVRNQITQHEESVVSYDRESQRLEREMAAALADIESMGGRRGQLGLSFETESQRVSALQSRIVDTRGQINEKRAAETSAKRHLDGMRAEYATALGKRNSLEAVINEHGYSTESVKRLFQSGALEGGLAPVGVLADFLAVDDKYEAVVEDFLRDELNYVVVKSWASVDEGLRLLKSDGSGRATFLVHPSDSQAKFSFAVNESLRMLPPRDTVVPLTRCIQVLNGFGKSLEVILPKLREGFIAPDAGLARELALENPDAFYLAPTGETFHNVTVTGGKQRSEGPLSLKRELREVVKQMAELEGGLRNEDGRILQLGHELTELTALLSRLEEELREAEKQAMTHGHALQQMEAEINRNQQRLDSYRLELERVVAQRAEKQAAIAARHEEQSLLETQRQQLEAEIATATAAMSELKTEREAAAQVAAESAVKVAGLEERRRGAAASLQRIESLAGEVGSRVENLKGQIAAAAAEKQQREAENLAIAERLVELTAERQLAEQRAAELHAESEQLRARLAEIEGELKQARHDLDAARDRRGELAGIAAKLRSDTEHMGETCLNELSVGADELRGDLTIALLEGETLAAEDALYREMRGRLEAMGPVNMMALEEYKEIAQRHEFLETQRKDLLESIENTQSTIKEIDVISRQKFEEAFHKINENFQRTFTKLFGGGQGFMRLTDTENATESGIDIVASPPGKKLQNVLLLSGGEKALTALSLLVGIFQYQPSPFCILDEVDAPLDEANVGRFAEMVKEMSVQTQFILITHSKRTMQAAPVMYGVTMQEPGVSKVVSVKFGEDRQLATA
ncbi:MAG TPA: chromosome segregation protein SMC [Terriglobales bacterium]|nr:chromosome segregation protein SMC [Terriglobales bacterium]